MPRLVESEPLAGISKRLMRFTNHQKFVAVMAVLMFVLVGGAVFTVARLLEWI